MPGDSLSLLRDAIQARLAADTNFSTSPAVDVISEEAGDLQNKITVALGKIGVLCVVPLPRLAPGELNRTLVARPRVDLFENVLLNRTGSGYKNAPELLIATYNSLTGWAPASGFWNELVFVEHEFEVKGNAIHHILHFRTDLLT
jgi:hypothetical protein